MRGGSSATTRGASSRSRAVSRRMNRSSGAGRSSTAEGPSTPPHAIASSRVTGYLKRLLTGAAAYQLADIVSKFLALALLPVYTRHLTKSDYGTAELLTTLVIFVSILVRLGIVEAFVRYWYEEPDDAGRRALARRSILLLLLLTTVLSIVFAIFAGSLSELILDTRDTKTFLAA